VSRPTHGLRRGLKICRRSAAEISYLKRVILPIVRFISKVNGMRAYYERRMTGPHPLPLEAEIEN
jgi:hypothetical protein